MKFIFLVVIAASVWESSLQTGWSYDDEKHWGDKCGGRSQSPVNIDRKVAIEDVDGDRILGPLVMTGYEDVTVTALNNGHTLKWKLWGNSTPPTMSGGPLKTDYQFLQLHLHWLSEHAIDGLKYAMEIHMVHIKSGLSVAEALNQTDGLAVLGVMYQVQNNAESEFALQDIMPMVPSLVLGNSVETATYKLNLLRLMSSDIQSYYTYSGSLTTPSCDEAVVWIVMDNPVPMSDTQFKTITKVEIGGVTNYRSVQPLNGRLVYRPSSSCTTISLSNFASLMTALMTCSSTFYNGILKKGFCLIANLKRKILKKTQIECSKN